MGGLKRRNLLRWILIAVFAYVEAAPQNDPLESLRVFTQDPFTQAPDNLGDFEPGTILRIRRPPSPVVAFGAIPLNIEDSFQILYRTTDSFNASIATILTVLVPRQASLDKVISYQFAENSASGDCAPSNALQQKENSKPLLGRSVAKLETLLVAAALQRGWVVIIPDYESPTSAYLANELAGHAVLDGIRAATRSKNLTGIAENPIVAMWGYSGGSSATGWAAELQSSYAPEVKIAGAALGGTLPKIASLLNSTDKSLFANLIPIGLSGLSRQYKAIADLLDGQLLPEYKKAFAAAAKACFPGLLTISAFRNVRDMFRDPTVFQSEPITSIFTANDMGKVAPQMPLYIYKPLLDQISPVRDTDGLISFYCESGASVEYVRQLDSEHIFGMFSGAPGALSWLSGIMDGNATRSGCVIKNRVSSQPEVDEIIPASATDKLLDAFKEISREAT